MNKKIKSIYLRNKALTIMRGYFFIDHINENVKHIGFTRFNGRVCISENYLYVITHPYLELLQIKIDDINRNCEI